MQEPDLKCSKAPSLSEIISLTSLSLPTQRKRISDTFDISFTELHSEPEYFFIQLLVFSSERLNTRIS